MPCPPRWIPACCVIGLLAFLTAYSLADEPAAESASAATTQVAGPAKSETQTDAGHGKTLLFETDILPLLTAKCGKCHNEKTRKAELDLSSFAGVMRGSESGAVITPHKPEESSLYEMVHEGYMPPEEKDALAKADVEKIHHWIADGAASKNAGELATADEMTQHDVLPILYVRCIVCHGRHKQEGGLDLRTRAAMLQGGKSGPAIDLEHPEESLLVKRIRSREMPPGKLLIRFGVRPVESSELETLIAWIAAGAPEKDVAPDVATTEPDPLVTDQDRAFWSFQSPQRPDVPQTKQKELVHTPIDAFLLRKLEAEGLSYSAAADRLTLIRRVCFDLTGLPPEWADVEEFLSDTRPDAYARMVDQYLDSPRYGERWGRYWLDLAGYADSEGKRSADPIRAHAWRYRDYVVRAFNNDKPYDRFLMEQLAGDELADYESAETITQELADNLIATGFLRMAPDGTGSDVVNTVEERLEVIHDELNVLGSSVLGLTLKCARCHSHKYDPIPQRDYYRLMAVFKGAYDEHDWLKPSSVPGQSRDNSSRRVLSYVSDAEKATWEKEKAKVEAEIAALEKTLDDAEQEYREQAFEAGLAKLPEEIREAVRETLETPEKKRTPEQQELAKKHEKSLTFDRRGLRKQFPEFERLAFANERKAKALQSGIQGEPQIRALWDRGVPSPTYIYRRGEWSTPGRLVGPGVPSVLTDGRTPFDVQPPWPGSEKTGRRLALARWITRPDHPLTARVMVNRIWYHHFGRGIVTTLDNFGKTGTPPSHPELLDWLATEFVENDWSIKHIHRLILNSRAWQQVSDLTDELETRDPENALVSRMPLRRMEAEVVRDSLLMVSGRLDLTPFGIPDSVKVRPDGLVVSTESDNGWRRSLYVMHRRRELPTILETFDQPQMIPNCTSRPTSTVASQALHLLNNGMVRQLAEAFAERIRQEAGPEPYRQVERAFQVSLSRSPSDAEREVSIKALDQLRTAWAAELQETSAEATTSDDGATSGEQNAPAKKSGDQPTPEQRALANLCHSLLNSAAFLYID